MNRSRVLITGITGFAGSHLAEYILQEEPRFEVWGSIRLRSRRDNILGIQDRLYLVCADLMDAESARTLVAEVMPSHIFHLAAQSFVPFSWNAPGHTFQSNVIAQINLLEAVKEYVPEARIQIACSSEEYGLVLENEVPIKETNPLRPLSPYAVSKVAQDFMGYQYWQSHGIPIIRTRAFNHTGPRRGECFVSSNFARQIVRIRLGLADPVIRVGNLDARRDFTDVRDTVRGYFLACTMGEPGEVYNICSGRDVIIKDMLDCMLFGQEEIKVEVDEARLRPSDVPILKGDSSKFKARTGWTPEIPFEQTLDDLLRFWEERES